MSVVESQLEDLAFEILEPDKYEGVRSEMEAESTQWRSYVDRVCAILSEEMQKLGLHAVVSGRVKHLYSFYKKLERNAGDVERLEDLKAAADFSQIHDIIAFRILVDSTPDCYLALGHVHSLSNPSRMKFSMSRSLCLHLKVKSRICLLVRLRLILLTVSIRN